LNIKSQVLSVEGSQRLKERVYNSRALQYSYRSWLDLQTGFALLRSQPYEASRRLLHMWRHLGDEVVGRSRVARLMQIVRENCYRDGQLLPASENGLRREFICSQQAKQERAFFQSCEVADRVRLRVPNDDDPERQGNLIILKPYDAVSGERGVILVMYGEAMAAFAANFDLGALASRYTIVLETSGWGYQDARFFLYLGRDLDVVIHSPRVQDFEFINELRTNLTPVRVGSGEWVDPSTFRPRSATKEPNFDAVMVAAWDPLKRHELLFQAVAKLKQGRARPLRLALIGYPLGWTREPIEGLLNQYGLADDCTIFERIPHAEVSRIVSESRVSLLLSRQEGSNRSVYESMFCGTPVIVYRHHRGINLDHVNERTGLLADDHELVGAIGTIIDHPERFDPRGWAEENIGYENATRKVNAALKSNARRFGLPWTRDIVAKRNAPNLRYGAAGQYKDFADEYDRLIEFLLPIN
jgi:glycosyltransferase involved in cell wall biosynthesis